MSMRTFLAQGSNLLQQGASGRRNLTLFFPGARAGRNDAAVFRPAYSGKPLFPIQPVRG